MSRVIGPVSAMSVCWILLAMPSSQAEELIRVPNLQSRIAEFQAQHRGPGPNEQQRAVMNKAAEDLAAALPTPGLVVGTRAPDFALPGAYGETVRLSEQLTQGPVVLAFYRGAWCPYCNLQLRALKESQPHFERYRAQLIAITPQTPDRSHQQYRKDDYPFQILSDLDDSVMKAYNLYFEVPEALRSVYIQDFNLDIAAYNGNGRYGLPVPGTFIIDRQGIIRAVFADTDYKKRMEPADIVEALAGIEPAHSDPLIKPDSIKEGEGY